METNYISNCPLSEISWLWYGVAVVSVFALGMIWYTVFTKPWSKAVKFECPCGANIAGGEKCRCKPTAGMWLTFFYQFVATCLIGLMYFVLTDVSIWLSVIVAVAVSGWMKSMLKFRIMDFKQWVILCSIDVGYFFLGSVIFVLFALL